MSEKYITEAEILEWVQEIRPDVASIPDRIMIKGNTWVDRQLVMMKVNDIPTKSDSLGFLREAASCFILSLCCKARIITQTTGELLTDRFGDRIAQFQRQQPMFFFAQGTAESFQRILPYETFRMMGIEYCRAYKQQYIFYSKRGIKQPKGVVVTDKTSRGKGWNTSVYDIEEADAEDGNDYVPEEDSYYNRKKAPYWTYYD